MADQSSKFIQIAVAACDTGGMMLFALDDAGQVWRHDRTWSNAGTLRDHWSPVHNLRMESSASVPPTPGARD